MHRLSLWSPGPELRVIPEIVGNLEPNVTGTIPVCPKCPQPEFTYKVRTCLLQLSPLPL